MIRGLAVMMLMTSVVFAANDPSVTIETPHLNGPRPLAKQTETAVIHDYLQAWKGMSAAMEQNRAELLDQDFIGEAREKLGATIGEQTKAGVHVHYQDRSHDIKIIFYSPEGLSIQLVDDISYDEQILDNGKVVAEQPVHARYVAVLTPTEVQWKVRILQSEPE
jgi:hypothetical protein